MTVKQLQSLIAAGAFSASLLTGIAYADDSMTQPAAPAPKEAPAAGNTAMTDKPKHMKKHSKSMAKHSCAGTNSCKGQGGCKTGDGSCAGKNSCKGKGGCATDESKK